MKPKAEKKQWFDAICERAGMSTDEVEQVLSDYRIKPSPVVPSPKQLQISAIRFSGDKGTEDDPNPFGFEWSELHSGLWALLTDRNFRGKTTVVEVLRWALRGEPSDTLQTDVRSWIRELQVAFQLDDVSYELEVTCGESVSGGLYRYSTSGKRRRVAGFHDENEFRAVVEDFFMRAFSMEDVAVYRKLDTVRGRTVLHGWQAISGAMFIGTNYETLIGELPFSSGLPIRLMQMYLGLPWISTLSAAKSAVSELSRKQAVMSKLQDDAKAESETRLKKLNAELSEKKSERDKLPDVSALLKNVKSASSTLRRLNEEDLRLSKEIRKANGNVDAVKAAYADDRRELQTHVESQAASTIFRVLDPTNCPRCEKSISAKRKTDEQKNNCCSVCGEAIRSDVSEEEVRRELTNRMNASKQAKHEASQVLKDLESRRETLAEELKNATKEQAKLARQVAKPGRRNALDVEIAVLETRIDEVSSALPKTDEEPPELRILNAVVVETDKRLKERQVELLEKISDGILAFAQRFGMSGLTSVKLLGNLSLSLTKSGESTSYSYVTPGEKLRLKVATVLAMIQVGTKMGVGRYPGMLVIDSPGAQEVASEDLEQLILGLSEVAAELEHLQVFVASIASEPILKHVPSVRQKRAKGDDYLW
ncbi:MAG: large ATP-binding protein [Phycisphaera sp. RhM]|nr:large ATP-binding protein [Phycisphaera sp. RhM]